MEHYTDSNNEYLSTNILLKSINLWFIVGVKACVSRSPSIGKIFEWNQIPALLYVLLKSTKNQQTV